MFLNFNEKDKFKNFLLKSISMQMPKVFIENFNDLEKFSSLENLPASPEKIVTAKMHFGLTVFLLIMLQS